jgi:hypothetical protein
MIRTVKLTLQGVLVLFVLIAGATMNFSASAKSTFDILGEKAGDKCMQTVGGPGCCKAELNCAQFQRQDKAGASKPNQTLAYCEKGQRVCDKMLTCNRALNACKKEKMATDKACDGGACKKCTLDYKTCHDTAVGQ